MKYSIDMHIHSALSPCASSSMTPNNIINMAYIKKLDIISVTDHNCMFNVQSILKLGLNKNILVVPGIEVTTKEEIHVLCYFIDLNKAMQFQNIIYDSLPDIENNEKIFGKQLILDEKDYIVGKVQKLLLSTSQYSIEEVNEMVQEFCGIMVPAHIDRKSYSILSVLGFIPKNLDVKTIELSTCHQLTNIDKSINLNRYNIITNSDAHDLYAISEPEYFIDIPKLCVQCVIDYLKNKKRG